MKRLYKTGRICWAVGHKLCPSLQTLWTGFPIDSPWHSSKTSSVQGNGEPSPCLPSPGHSQFQFPAIKAIWSKCTSRATGNTFSSFYLSSSITFSFKRTPPAFLPSGACGSWGALWDVVGSLCPGSGALQLQGFWRRSPGLGPGPSGAPGHGDIAEQHQELLPPFCETASLARPESSILLQEVGVYFLNANLVGKRVWLVAVAGLSEYSIMASKFKIKWRCCSPPPPPKHTSGEWFSAKVIFCTDHQKDREWGKKCSSQANKTDKNKTNPWGYSSQHVANCMWRQ